MRPPIRGFAGLAVLAGGIAVTFAAPASGPSPSSMTSGVTIYGATWCGSCRSLESQLTQRSVPFDVIDVDRNPQAFERARSESGTGASIPLTNVSHGSAATWILGDNADAVERAYKAP